MNFPNQPFAQPPPSIDHGQQRYCRDQLSHDGSPELGHPPVTIHGSGETRLQGAQTSRFVQKIQGRGLRSRAHAAGLPAGFSCNEKGANGGSVTLNLASAVVSQVRPKRLLNFPLQCRFPYGTRPACSGRSFSLDSLLFPRSDSNCPSSKKSGTHIETIGCQKQ
jgi:hypothetical protein